MKVLRALHERKLPGILFLLFLLRGSFIRKADGILSFGLSLSDFYGKIGSIKTDKELRNMLRLFKKEQQSHGKRQLRSLIDFISMANGEERKETARTLIFALADKMRVEAILGVVNQEETLDTGNVWDALFCKVSDASDWRYTYESHTFLRNMFKDSEQELAHDKQISLSDQPVIAIPWNYVGLNNALSGIGTTQNQWRQIESNHAVTVLLPMDVAVVTSGRHSICAGAQKRKGFLRLYNGMENQWRQIIYDLSALYRVVEFDGEDYIWITNEYGRAGGIAAKAANFDFGCIFELARFLL